MISFRNLSIPNKIVAISMIISGAALLLASGALILYDFNSAGEQLTASSTVFARIIADNINAAVSFNDPTAAVETLNSLRVEPSIVAACVYTQSQLFAHYLVEGAKPCPEHSVTDASSDNSVTVSTPIQLNGKNIGTVQVRATLSPAYSHLRLEIVTMVAILIIAGLFAYALSYRLQKFVSEPVLNLASAAKEISRAKDYSIRASKQNEDELGVLVDAFNEMLAQIQNHERDLKERTTDLVKASRMKDEFLATLSHELRTPLNSILGWAVLAREGRLSIDRHKSALEAIERNARVQARLIEDLLDVSRIISGKFTLDSSIVSLNQIIDSAIDVVRPAAEAKRIQIEFEKPSMSVRVNGDGARLQQAVWNLLSNAVKFSGENASVIARLSGADHFAQISVADSGVGIDAEFLPYVFDRFRQADGSSTRKHGGLGLGLAIVRHIVEMHGGSVRVESAGRGQGTTFTIVLPMLSTQQYLGESLSRRRM